MWDWIVKNIITIKELLWIVFTFVATLIAILTYKRARFTLLQPLKTEVIKRQTDLLIKLLDFLDSSVLLSLKFDYITIVELNMYKILADFGVELSEEKLKFIEENSCGALFNNDCEVVCYDQENMFDVEKDINDVSNNGDTVALKTKDGKVKLEAIYYTKKHMRFILEFQEFLNNPFMPKKIKSELDIINKDIHENISIIMKKSLEDFINNFDPNKNSCDDKFLQVYHLGIYNHFNRQSENHETNKENIRKLIKEYLMIDKSWN